MNEFFSFVMPLALAFALLITLGALTLTRSRVVRGALIALALGVPSICLIGPFITYLSSIGE